MRWVFAPVFSEVGYPEIGITIFYSTFRGYSAVK